MKKPKEYPRFVKPYFKPFDPVELAKETEKIVTRRGPEGLERKYENFYSTDVYGGKETDSASDAASAASSAGLIGLATSQKMRARSFEIPFQAIKNLLDHNVSFHVAYMSAEPRIMTTGERTNLIKKMAEIDPRLLLNLEEVMDGYDTTLARLKFAGLNVKWSSKEFYPPIKELLKKKQA